MFYLFEHHTGDENDNSIDDVVFEAKDLNSVWDCLEKKHKQYNGMIDGDEQSFTCLFNDSANDRMLHSDYYLQGEYSSDDEAIKARQHSHGWLGIVKI